MLEALQGNWLTASATFRYASDARRSGEKGGPRVSRMLVYNRV